MHLSELEVNDAAAASVPHYGEKQQFCIIGILIDIIFG